MKLYSILIFFVLCSMLTQAQSYRDTLFQHYTLTHPKLKTFDIHVTKSSSGQKKPLIVYLDGSGNYPVFYKNKAGRYSTTVPLDVRRYAKLNKKVTHVVSLVGNALNHLFDFILEARLKAERQQISPEESQAIVDSLYREYAKIYQNPQAIDQSWYGATNLKWSSFSKTTPLENMLKLDIPILYIAGGKDNNQTILGMDYAKLEFLRQGKNNLTYKVYPRCNHFFQEENNVDGNSKRIDRIDEVHQFAIEWVNGVSKE